MDIKLHLLVVQIEGSGKTVVTTLFYITSCNSLHQALEIQLGHFCTRGLSIYVLQSFNNLDHYLQTRFISSYLIHNQILISKLMHSHAAQTSLRWLDWFDIGRHRF